MSGVRKRFKFNRSNFRAFRCLSDKLTQRSLCASFVAIIFKLLQLFLAYRHIPNLKIHIGLSKSSKFLFLDEQKITLLTYIEELSTCTET